LHRSVCPWMGKAGSARSGRRRRSRPSGNGNNQRPDPGHCHWRAPLRRACGKIRQVGPPSSSSPGTGPATGRFAPQSNKYSNSNFTHRDLRMGGTRSQNFPFGFRIGASRSNCSDPACAALKWFTGFFPWPFPPPGLPRPALPAEEGECEKSHIFRVKILPNLPRFRARTTVSRGRKQGENAPHGSKFRRFAGNQRPAPAAASAGRPSSCPCPCSRPGGGGRPPVRPRAAQGPARRNVYRLCPGEIPNVPRPSRALPQAAEG